MISVTSDVPRPGYLQLPTYHEMLRIIILNADTYQLDVGAELMARLCGPTQWSLLTVWCCSVLPQMHKQWEPYITSM